MPYSTVCSRSFSGYSLKLAFFLLSLFIAPVALSQTLTSTPDRTVISEDETLNLSVRYNGSGNVQGQPDFSTLSMHFEILNQSQTNKFHRVNDRVEAFTEWKLVIAPRSTGTLLIPSFRYQGAISDAVQIQVNKAAALAPGVAADIFIETLVDKTSAYEQQQLVLKYRFYYSVSVDELAKEEPSFNDVIVEPLEESRYGKTINGKPYQVVEFGYALFPQSSGLLEIPALTWKARISRSPRRSIFDFNGGHSEIKRIKTEAKAVNIKEKPAGFPAGAPWLPASALSLEERWAGDPGNFNVGEPITRTLDLQANGVMSSQLPELLTEPSDPRIKFYPDQPKHEHRATDSGLLAQRLEAAAVVVAEGGEITVPAVRLAWWNTTTDSLEYAEIPQRRFIVASSDDRQENQRAREEAIRTSLQAEEQQPVQTVEKAVYPLWLSLLCAILAAAVSLMGFLWYQAQVELRHVRQQLHTRNSNSARSISEKQAFKALQKACAKPVKVKDIREAALTWANSFAPTQGIYSLADLARLQSDEQLQRQCLALDAAVFGYSLSGPRNNAFDGEEFIAAITALKNKNKKTEQAIDESLTPLYP